MASIFQDSMLCYCSPFISPLQLAGLQILTEQEQNACVQPVILTQPAAGVMSDQNPEDDEEDWQQLSALPQAPAPSTSGRDSRQTPPLMYIDHSAAEAEPMGFRELFLRSSALENLFAGMQSLSLNFIT